jgi:hypothetical protein
MKTKFIALTVLGFAAASSMFAMGEKGCTPETCKTCAVQSPEEKAFCDKLTPANKEMFMKMTAEQKMECMKKDADANKAVEMMMKVEKK